MDMFLKIVQVIYGFFWNDLITIPLPGGGTIGFSLLVLILIPAGIFFTIRTKFLSVRCFPEMIRIAVEKNSKSENENSISGVQALIVSTATRVGMGNLVGVVAAISVGGAGAVFWMWITALLGMATAFIEATLAQLHKEEDPLYGGYRGGPAYYIHNFFAKGKKKSIIAILFAFSGLICWCGVSQVISNSVTDSFHNAFQIPPIYTTIALVAISAIIVLRKNATVKVLDIMVPIMAGSGSAPCAAAAADVSHPVKSGLLQALGVFIDTIVICTCTAMIMLLVPEGALEGLSGMGMLQGAMDHHFGKIGVVFIAVVLWLFCFSTFIGILYYARSNVAYIFGDNWKSQTAYKIVALVMLFIGGIATYTFVWDMGDIGIGCMTIFNMIALIPMHKQAIASLDDYYRLRKMEKKNKISNG